MIAPDGSDFLMPAYANEDHYRRKGYISLTPGMDRPIPHIMDGAWAGKRCFIVGGGPSLKGFDWSMLDNELSIGINRALEFYTPTVSFSIDSRWYVWTTNGDLGEDAKRRYEQYRGHKVQLNANSFQDFPEDVQQLQPYPHPRRISGKMRDGICHGDNSGMAAIDLAICLGATEIYLLGFDCNVHDGDQEHYHDGYPETQRSKVYQKFIASMNVIAPTARARARIINCNPDSGLKCWEFGTPPWEEDLPVVPEVIEVAEEDKPKRPPVVVQQDIKDGMWQDQPCVIVGGGSSLKDFDFNALAGFHTIGINRAYESFDPSVMFVSDHRFLRWIYDDKFGSCARELFDLLTCPIVLGAAVNQFHGAYRDRYIPIPANEPQEDDMAGELTESFDDGLLRSTSSGVPALNFALNAGANPIYLLGFDCQPGLDESTHFHAGYFGNHKPQPYESHIAGFERIADDARKRARIVNCSNWSALTCFEFGKLPEYLVPQQEEVIEPVTQPTTEPVFVSYATPAYQGHANKLAESLETHGCEYDIEFVDSLGSWEANCGMKPSHIKRMRKKHKGRRVVWVDADAVLCGKPDLFGQLNGADVAFHRLDGKELLSGTLYFAPGARATRLLTRWEKAQAANPTEWDQKTLDAALVGWKGKPSELPASYCRIADNPRQVGVEAIIEHHQASRELKRVAQ